VVLGQAALLASTPEAKRADRVRKISVAADRCARIVKNFLALARQHPPERSRVALNRIARESVELLAYGLRVDNVEVALALDEGLPPVLGDPHQLQQVLINLITNAHHALRKVPGPRRITVATRCGGAAGPVVLEVADTGPGIPREIQQKIFEPFFTTKPVGEGTGLGLAICAGIVETHGGRLALDSEPGRGATLRVELPAESAPEAVAGERARVTAAGPRGSILLVDDEADVLEVLGDLLGAAGHRVETARDGIEALERLGAGDYDLVLSDIRMPRLDGRGLYQHAVRARPEMAGRFVMVTGDMLTGETLRFLEESGVPSVAKPFEPEAILRMVGERLAAARP
jgi:CheY-like chemotaxis protein